MTCERTVRRLFVSAEYVRSVHGSSVNVQRTCYCTEWTGSKEAASFSMS